ncbi:signal recognition particle-docking protein FtsY [Streptococcus sp. DTU_2020_1001019_1_SI_AUS_MUR_006]|uniref:signal recognition particle-docking protein FtsY n=1 Tax=Streptococcus sp. DTU_2020_1001019_1_SI_AUS_MUR_006 TaxID=3077584 RepID=UPI0028ECB98C|nr:signal recognition particle-docking protein FtsY [Streptococcus sp. DTU_2020_1001019_1_SI_AUS_MUR_006]WNS72067.1 signal recognition particle-docking protein FtsY [Streptococcus sp. DTU_2020_1001019_1_SI_AUS_MUR_006]
MGLFDRLFGRKEEPKIEEVVKEALENLDLTEPSEEVEALGTEEVEVKNTEETDQSSEFEETYSKEASESEEPVAETTLETVEAETTPQEEETQFEEETECHCCQEESESTEVEERAQEVAEFVAEELESPVEEVPSSDSDDEEANQAQSDETEADTSEKVEEDLVIEEIPQVQETVQEKYDRSLKKTRTGFGARLNAFFANFRSVDEEFFEELEELLIMSDVGVQVASNLTEELRYEAKLENAKKPDVLRRVIIEKLVELYEKDGQYNESINFQDGLTVMLFVGVNGVGKTTSIGKLANRYKQAGKKVMLVAADTFRAGAVAQLAEWGRRVDVPVVTGPEKADPASVVFDGMERAVAEGVDILMIDTAGRLQNKENLMAELEKIGRIIKRVVPEAPHETFLALDASTGQNALVQAKEFSKITPVTGIVLTKIDGTARGGVVLAIREELNIPVKLIGFGEKIDDIGEFNSENFMKGLLEGLI